MEELVSRAIARVPGWRESDLVVTPITGGITNTSYLVKRRANDSTEAFVLRIGGKTASSLGIDRHRELAAMRVVERIDLGAPLVFADPGADILVTRFVGGGQFRFGEPPSTSAMQRAARAVRRIHEAAAFDGTFSPFETVRTYSRTAAEHGGLIDAAGPALELSASLERMLSPDLPACPCHNDLLPANILDDAGHLRIIDWEYAAMGDRWFDLGNLAANLELSDDGIFDLLTAYLERAPLPVEMARVTAMTVVSDLREGFWALVQRGQSSIDFDFDEYAKKHLERALRRSTEGPIQAAHRTLA